MSASRNPYQKTIRDLFERTNLYHGMLSHLNIQLGGFKLLLQEKQKEQGGTAAMGAATALVLSDLTEWPRDHWRRHYASGSFFTRGHRFLGVIRELTSLVAGWTVAQGYEAFKTFLLDSVARYLKRHPDKLSPSKQRILQNRISKPVTIAEWREFAESAFRKKNNRELFQFLRKSCPHLSEVELLNNRNLNLRVWYEAVSTVRHAVVHSSGVIRTAEWAKLDSKGAAMIRSKFQTKKKNEGYVLKMKVEEAGEALKTFNEYAFGIFKSLSLVDGFKVENIRKIAFQRRI